MQYNQNLTFSILPFQSQDSNVQKDEIVQPFFKKDRQLALFEFFASQTCILRIKKTPFKRRVSFLFFIT